MHNSNWEKVRDSKDLVSAPRRTIRDPFGDDMDQGVPDVHPGDVVRVEEGIGVVRYLGEVRFAKGLWAGVELVEKLGMHDGQVGGKRYFRCKPNHGVLCDSAKITKKIKPEELLERVTLLNNENLDLRKENEKITSKNKAYEAKLTALNILEPPKPQVDCFEDIELGDRVRLSNRKTGTVKFIGRTRGDPETFVGLEMHSWISNGNNGIRNGHRYFHCRNGWGYFARKAQVVEIVEKSEKQPEVPRLDFKIGDRVEIDRQRTGVVKYLGDVDFTKDEMVGLEMDVWTSFGHDGTVGGKRYFQASHGKGYFCKYESVVRVLAADEEVKPPRSSFAKFQGIGKSRSSFLREDGLDLNKLDKSLTAEMKLQLEIKRLDSVGKIKIGQMVRLKRGREGTVKFIGHVDFTAEEVIGLELTQWTEKGHDGSLQGKRYFTCAAGRGYFTKRANIALVGVDVDDIPDVFTKGSDEIDPMTVKVGDRIRLKRGKVGVVKFIGKVPGIKRECVVGMELDTVGDELGHDGFSPIGDRIFACSPAHGYWTSKESIEKILKRPRPRSVSSGNRHHARRGTDMCMPMPEVKERTVDIEFSIGDTVRLARGKEGIVRFIGRVEGMKQGGEVIGLELNQWSQKGHDGTHKGKKYFSCPPGRGYFTTRKAVAELLKKASTADREQAVPREEPVPEEQPEKSSKTLIEVSEGERVRLRNGRTGTVWYIGKAGFAKGEVVGMELDQWAVKGNDGSMKGVRYFSCPSGHGYFTRREAIVEKLEQTRRLSKRKSAMTGRARGHSIMSDAIREPSPEIPSLDINGMVVKIGDRIRLKRGKIGTIKYIGPVKGTEQTVIGLELTQWYERGNDGTFKGVRYFETRGHGWGYFTKPTSIAEVIK